MNKKEFTIKFNEAARAREMLAQAILRGCGESYVSAVLASDLASEALTGLPSGHESDQALVFSEFTPDGDIVPMSWVLYMERFASEPMTVVRVSADVVADVKAAL